LIVFSDDNNYAFKVKKSKLLIKANNGKFERERELSKMVEDIQNNRYNVDITIVKNS